MVDYSSLRECCMAETDVLRNICGIPGENIVLIASADVVSALHHSRGFGVVLDPTPYSRCAAGYYFGYEVRVVPGDSFFRPVVVYDKTIRSLPNKTLLTDRYNYNLGVVAASALRMYRRSGDNIYLESVDDDVFYNGDAAIIDFDDLAEYDNTAIMAFYNNALGKTDDADATRE